MIMRIVAIILVVLAVAGAALGYLTQVDPITVAPVVVGIGIILAIFARLAQAEYHNNQQMERLKAIHIMIRDEIDRASIVGPRFRNAAPADEDDDSE
jgi:hypothetical protein